MGKTASLANIGTIADSSLGFRNRLINGACVIDQRNAGASVTINTSPIYTIDRWFCGKSGTGNNFTAQRSTTAPAGFTNSLLITAGTGVTPISTDFMFLSQAIEGFNFADLAWGTASASAVSLSFWVRSSLTGTFGVGLRNGAANRSYIASYTISAANTWEQKTITIAGDTSGTWATDNTQACGVFFDLGNGSNFSSTAGAWSSANLLGGLTGGVKLAATTGATLNITGVQLEKGSTATSFDYRPIGTELALCQRYFFRKNAGAIGDAIAQLQTFSTSGCFGKLIDLPVTMRANPVGSVSSITHFSPTTAGGGGGAAFSGGAIDYVSPTALGTTAFTGSSGLVAGNATTITANNASLWIAASAEL